MWLIRPVELNLIVRNSKVFYTKGTYDLTVPHCQWYHLVEGVAVVGFSSFLSGFVVQAVSTISVNVQT